VQPAKRIFLIMPVPTLWDATLACPATHESGYGFLSRLMRLSSHMAFSTARVTAKPSPRIQEKYHMAYS
jgi:hypothetical protein